MIGHDEGCTTPLVGQVQARKGEQSARLSYLLPIPELGQSGLPSLLEALAWFAGSSGALHLLAEVEEKSPVFQSLRRAGFSVYGWQHIWQFPPEYELSPVLPNLWQPASDMDEIAIRSLFHALVPPLVQAAEPIGKRSLNGMVYRQGDEILAYVDGIYGPAGVYLQPLFHPAVDNAADLLRCLPGSIPFLMGRTVYLSMRSYQAWLETALHTLKMSAAPRQVLLVKHLAAAQRVPSAVTITAAAFEKHQPAMIGPGTENAHPFQADASPQNRDSL